MVVETAAARATFTDRVGPGLKIAAQVSPEADDDHLRFIRQLGVDDVVLWTNAEHSSATYYADRKTHFAARGLNVFGFGNADVHNQDAIVLGLANQEAKIEEYLEHLRSLGAAGIPYTTYAHMPNGIWSTEREPTRGEASARAFDESTATAGHWHGREFPLPLTNEREYSEDEVWEHFTHFITQAARVAEEENVFIGIHPDDPPISRMGGVPRIFSTFENYKRALAIADSPNVGVCLCVGCWLEGGDLWGVDAETAIRHFAAEDKLFKVHFRNVDAPLPHFVETFVDDGYGDMYAIMRALVEVGFRGVAIPDHIPLMGDDPRLGTAYTIGYMNALLHRARADVAAS
jgi:mannonate dehydratase